MSIYPPLSIWDRDVLTQKLGELFGVDPDLIKDYHAESDDGGPYLVTVKLRKHVPRDQFNALLNEATDKEKK